MFECSWFDQKDWFLIYHTSAQYQFVILWQVIQMGLSNMNWLFIHLAIFDHFQKSFDWCALPYGSNAARDFSFFEFGPSAKGKFIENDQWKNPIVLLSVLMVNMMSNECTMRGFNELKNVSLVNPSFCLTHFLLADQSDGHSESSEVPAWVYKTSNPTWDLG